MEDSHNKNQVTDVGAVVTTRNPQQWHNSSPLLCLVVQLATDLSSRMLQGVESDIQALTVKQ